MVATIPEELGEKQEEPTPLFVDNQSAIKLAHNPEFHQRSKHIDVRYHWIREQVENKELEVVYVPSAEQLADINTKPLYKEKFQDLRDKLGMTDVSALKAGKTRKGANGYMAKAMMLLAFLSILTSSMGIQRENSIPVLWRKNKMPVVDGYLQVNLRVQLLNPCSMLNSSNIHTDLVANAVENCLDMYAESFQSELNKMCPSKDWTLINHREKRFIPLLILGGYMIFQVVIAGLAISGTVMGASNSHYISELQEKVKAQDEAWKNIEAKVNQNTRMIKELQEKFNSTIENLAKHQKDYDELKNKAVSSQFVISYITSRLTNGKIIIREAARQWKHSEVYAPLLDYFNFTMPCSDDCPIKYAKAGRCELSEERNKLSMNFMVSHVNNSLVLAEADPFILMMRKGDDQTCTVRYKGPRTALLSLTSNCVLSTNVEIPSHMNLLVAPASGCKLPTSLPEATKHFTVSHCEKRRPHDERDLIQVKVEHHQYHVYCPESDITIEGRTEPCPSGVFTLPTDATFKITDMRFTASKLNLEHDEKWDSIVTLKANWHIQPSINWTELSLGEPEEPVALNQPMDEDTNYGMWTITIGATSFSVMMFGITVTVIIRFRGKHTITVTARQIDGGINANDGEQENADNNG